MLVKDVVRVIEKKYPKEAALSFDNVGLQIGREDKRVQRVFLALDATDEVIEHAINWKADLLITHHPMIFKPLKSIQQKDFIGRRIIKLIQHDIPYYAMHTNYDVLGMAQLAGDVLELQEQEVLDATYQLGEQQEGIGRIGKLPRKMSLQECCDYVKNKLKLEHLKVFANFENTNIEYLKLAISPGAGKSVLDIAMQKEAQIIVTGDIDHHAGLDAVAQGLTVLDAGHYGTEYIFMDDVKEFIHKEFKDIEIKTEEIKQPFRIV